MNNRNYSKDVKQLAGHAMAMSVEGLKESILEDWENPQWPSMTFDAMNLALQRKMGKREYDKWFNSLPVKTEVQS